MSGLISLVCHLAIMTALLLVGRLADAPDVLTPSVSSKEQVSATPVQIPRIVFLQTPGTSSGGGGGGNRHSAPPSRAQGLGRDRLTVPVARPVVAAEQSAADLTQPTQQVVLDAMPLASGTALQIGLPDAPASLPFSQGPGVGGGVGYGSGTGIGSGTGPGRGPGSGGGFGGRAYRVGGGVVPPTLRREVKPKYTPQALMQKIQGTVTLEAVVDREGIPVEIRVTRSLDPGLDDEAIAAVREWQFTPGRIGKTPVAVLVTIWLDFRIN